MYTKKYICGQKNICGLKNIYIVYKNICCLKKCVVKKNIYVLKYIFVVYKKYMLGKISIVGY